MAGMLPGVEMARRRRTNHHFYSPREPSLHHPIQPSSAMGETALKARRKLEAKLGLISPSKSSTSIILLKTHFPMVNTHTNIFSGKIPNFFSTVCL
ncbi:hypothetical protein ACHQM5_014677 [Ranunculus cassubicifolius]